METYEQPGSVSDSPGQYRMAPTKLRGRCGPDCDSQATDETRHLLDHALDRSVAAVAENRTVLQDRWP